MHIVHMKRNVGVKGSIVTSNQRIPVKDISNIVSKIIELYLRAWNTQESIAEMFGVAQSTVVSIIKIGQMAEIGKDFTPPIYNIWNLQKLNKENC